MASETVICHNVITSGQLPRDMGWSDEAYRDVDDVLGAGADSMWIIGLADARPVQRADRARRLPEARRLPARGAPGHEVHHRRPEELRGLLGERPDRRHLGHVLEPQLRLRRRRRQQLARADRAQRARPTSAGASRAAASTSTRARRCPTAPRRRRRRGCIRSTATASRPGIDPAHHGGDVWTADAGMAMMEHETWSGMLLTLGAIDKASHMWGGITDTGTYPPGSTRSRRTCASSPRRRTSRSAGSSSKLRDLASSTRRSSCSRPTTPASRRSHFNGVNAAGRSDFNWYYGATQNGTFLAPSPSLAAADRHRQRALHLPGLGDPHVAHRHLAAAKMSAGQGDGDAAGRDRHVPAERDGDRYRLAKANLGAMNPSRARQWWQAHGQEIVDTMAAPYAADVVGLLARRHELRRGRRPRWRPEAGAGDPDRVRRRRASARATPKTALRSVDILPTILRAMGLQRGATLDGRAVALPH